MRNGKGSFVPVFYFNSNLVKNRLQVKFAKNFTSCYSLQKTRFIRERVKNWFKGLKFTTSLGFPLFISECLLTKNARHAQRLLEGSMRPLSYSYLISFAWNYLSEGDMRVEEAFWDFFFSRGLKGKETKYFSLVQNALGDYEVQSFSNFKKISKREYSLCIYAYAMLLSILNSPAILVVGLD